MKQANAEPEARPARGIEQPVRTEPGRPRRPVVSARLKRVTYTEDDGEPGSQRDLILRECSVPRARIRHRRVSLRDRELRRPVTGLIEQRATVAFERRDGHRMAR